MTVPETIRPRDHRGGISHPTVSIILPTYNRAATIRRAIDSVLNQTYKDFELLVVDDGSTDDTHALVSAYTDPRVRCLSLPVNGGAGKARNKGLEAARAELIAFQDSDDEWLPAKLEKQVAVLANAPATVGMVYTDMRQMLRDGTVREFRAPDVRRGKIANETLMDYQVRGIGQQTTLIRRACFEAVGVFDPALPQLIDLDFFIRLVLKFDAVRIEEPLVLFHQSQGISSNKKAHIRARLMLLEKYGGRLDRHFAAAQYAKIAEVSMALRRRPDFFFYLSKGVCLSPFSRKPWGVAYRQLKQAIKASPA
jgi:glycosyltransferase involved in cell wall biosynthesis